MDGTGNQTMTETIGRARIDAKTRAQASTILAAMGLNMSDAIRMMLLRVVDERRLPFDIKAPNATTRAALHELDRGKGRRFKDVDSLMTDLNADD